MIEKLQSKVQSVSSPVMSDLCSHRVFGSEAKASKPLLGILRQDGGIGREFLFADKLYSM